MTITIRNRWLYVDLELGATDTNRKISARAKCPAEQTLKHILQDCKSFKALCRGISAESLPFQRKLYGPVAILQETHRVPKRIRLPSAETNGFTTLKTHKAMSVQNL